MKTIFILEDNLYTAEDMYEEINSELENQNIYDVNIIVANSIDEANDKLNNILADELLCIIADLNMNPSGLTDEQKKQTHGAVLTGWVWIYSYVWQRISLKEKNIIFYSAFTNRLKSDDKYISLGYNQRKNIKLIDKSEHGIYYLCKTIISIINRSK